MSDTRELGNLAPVRAVLEWLEQQEAAEFAAEGAAKALTETRKRLEKAIADAQHADLEEGVGVAEYARLTGLTTQAVYKRIRRKRLPAKKYGKEIRILLAA